MTNYYFVAYEVNTILYQKKGSFIVSSEKANPKEIFHEAVKYIEKYGNGTITMFNKVN